MKRTPFEKEQILRILRKAKTAGSIQEVCREQNITLQTLQRWQRTHGDGVETGEQSSRPTRAERTREATAVNQLGLQIVAYPQADLDRLELPEELRDAIDACQAMKMKARARQKRLVCQILRGEDHDSIRERVELLEQSRLERTE